MKRTFASYEHTRIGFPDIVLKWHEVNGAHVEPYLAVDGFIKKWSWEFGQKAIHSSNGIERELARFDKYVLDVYGD